MTTTSKLHPGQEQGVVIGVLIGFDNNGQALVTCPGNPGETALRARSTTALNADDLGSQVAILWLNGAHDEPLIIGRLLHDLPQSRPTPDLSDHIQVQKPSLTLAGMDIRLEQEGKQLILSCQHDLTLHCGKASLVLQQDGKIILRGEKILSQARLSHRIKGGSIELN